MDYNYDPASLSTVNPAAIGISLGFVISGLIFVVFTIVGLWKIFTKAGVAGWKSLIPIYNVYCLLQIIGKPWWWLIMLIITPINIVFTVLTMYGLAKVFGKGVGYTLGLIFLPPIFFLLLGFGKDKYLGTNTVTVKETVTVEETQV